MSLTITSTNSEFETASHEDVMAFIDAGDILPSQFVSLVEQMSIAQLPVLKRSLERDEVKLNDRLQAGLDREGIARAFRNLRQVKARKAALRVVAAERGADL